MLYTTLNKIRAYGLCRSGWEKLLSSLGKIHADDEPLSFAEILDSNGLRDALWATRCAPEYDRQWRLFAVWCARSCQPVDADARSITAIDVAERFANGEATEDELAEARTEAWAAWADAWAEACADTRAEALADAQAKALADAQVKAWADARAAWTAAAAAQTRGGDGGSTDGGGGGIKDACKAKSRIQTYYSRIGSI